MSRITLQLIEGLERGRIYSELQTPVTIGREDDNTIRLNDERVSRFHAKIQEDGERVILTDLESTNGTRVNGHPVQIRVLQIGDQLSIGRCLLVYGSREQIVRKSRERQIRHSEGTPPGDHTVANARELADARPAAQSDGFVVREELFPDGPPAPPRELQGHQRAELSDFLAYAHEQIRMVIQNSAEQAPRDGERAGMSVPWHAWQRLLRLEMDLAVYLRQLADPED